MNSAVRWIVTWMVLLAVPALVSAVQVWLRTTIETTDTGRLARDVAPHTAGREPDRVVRPSRCGVPPCVVVAWITDRREPVALVEAAGRHRSTQFVVVGADENATVRRREPWAWFWRGSNLAPAHGSAATVGAVQRFMAREFGEDRP